MEFYIVREILKHLYIKKNNFKIEEKDLEFINELEVLLKTYNLMKNDSVNMVCNCEVDYSKINDEIEKNQCNSCGLILLLEE